MIERKTWKEFRDSGLLWVINRTLHIFGWAICIDLDDSGEVIECFPARCKFRGFSETCENDGFLKLTSYMAKNAETLLDEVKDG